LPLAMGQYVPSDHRAEANLRRQQKKFVERSILLSFLGTESGAEQGTKRGMSMSCDVMNPACI